MVFKMKNKHHSTFGLLSSSRSYHVQSNHLPHLYNSFVTTCRLRTASGGVHALLVLEPTECSTTTKQGA